MFGNYVPKPPEESKPKKPNGPPQACIKHTRSYSMCGRELDMNEFAFDDGPYAAKHYAESTVLKACSSCVKVVLQNLKDTGRSKDW